MDSVALVYIYNIYYIYTYIYICIIISFLGSLISRKVEFIEY